MHAAMRESRHLVIFPTLPGLFSKAERKWSVTPLHAVILSSQHVRLLFEGVRLVKCTGGGPIVTD